MSDFEEKVLELYDRAVDYLAEASAAQTWSTPTDDDLDRLGEDVLIIAEFGDWTAANGDLMFADVGKSSCRFCGGTGVKGKDNCYGCNGTGSIEVLPGSPGWNPEVLEGYFEADGGGDVPCTEEEVSACHVAGRIKIWLVEEGMEETEKLEREIFKVLCKEHGKPAKTVDFCVYTSVSGRADYYTKGKK